MSECSLLRAQSLAMSQSVGGITVNRRTIPVIVVLAITAASAFSGRPVAMLVETELRGSLGNDTVVAITVQAAPEDRRRLGRDVWIQIELMRAGQRVDRLARPADLDADGRATVEVAWPPGEYQLRVEIEGSGKDVTGVWMGKITVPTAGPQPPATPPTPHPTSVPTPAPAVAGTAAAASASTIEQSEPPSPETRIPSPEPTSTPPETDTPMTAPKAAVSAGAIAASSDPTSQRESQTPIPEPRAPSPETRAPSPEPRTPTPEPRTPTPEPRIPSPETRTSTWPTDDATTDLTVMVTERNRPVLGLQPESFNLRLGGNAVVIQEVGDASAAPLNLGLTVSIPTATPDQLDSVGGLIARFAYRTSGGRGSTMLTTKAIPTPSWDSDTGRIAAAVFGADAQGTSNLVDLVTTSLHGFEGRRGRSVLVLVTDGGDTAAKADWKGVSAVADQAGVPIFVIGLRDTGFPSKTRTTLGRLADSTGGRSYFLGDVSMLQMTLDYIGELIEGSYALRFTDPATGSGTPRAVKVQVGSKGWKVHAPSKRR